MAESVQSSATNGAGADIDVAETQEWIEAVEAVVAHDGPGRARRLRSIIRWNAIAIVVRANKLSSELGGHIASYQSLATLYEVGFNHFWQAPSAEHGGDLVYFQGHSSPGNYA